MRLHDMGIVIRKATNAWNLGHNFSESKSINHLFGYFYPGLIDFIYEISNKRMPAFEFERFHHTDPWRKVGIQQERWNFLILCIQHHDCWWPKTQSARGWSINLHGVFRCKFGRDNTTCWISSNTTWDKLHICSGTCNKTYQTFYTVWV